MAEKKLNMATAGFTPEQMEIIQALVSASKEPASNQAARDAVSRFTNVRNPKEIMSIPMYTMEDGKFVIGFKDLNKNPYRKVPKYNEVKLDVHRGLKDQPFVTLLLSKDGEDVEEREISLIDYMTIRQKVIIEKKDFQIKSKEVINEHGLIGRNGGSTFAPEINTNGQPVAPLMVKAETRRNELTFIINLPGFKHPVEMPQGFLA